MEAVRRLRDEWGGGEEADGDAEVRKSAMGHAPRLPIMHVIGPPRWHQRSLSHLAAVCLLSPRRSRHPSPARPLGWTPSIHRKAA